MDLYNYIKLKMNNTDLKLKVISNLELKMLYVVNSLEEVAEGYTEVGPYRAMYDYRYRSHTWGNFWNGEVEPTLSLIREIVGDPDWEEYLFSIIVKEGTSESEVDLIIKEIGGAPDYILERNNGKVNILHQTNYIDELVKNGYHSDYNSIDYSFGKGLYCLDKDNFSSMKGEWINSPNVYAGIYDGEYLRCIEDIDSGGKSGDNNSHEQEILIPFNEDKVEWTI